MQQQALGQLQAGLIDELESKGTFQDPETQKIMEKYQKVPVICFSKGGEEMEEIETKRLDSRHSGSYSKSNP